MASKNADVEAMVSGAGFLTDFLSRLISECKKRGKLEELHRVVTKDGRETLNKIADLIVGSAEVAPTFSRDMRKEGWTLLEHTSRRISSVANLELVPVLKSGEERVGGEEMIRRARVELNANLGQEDAEWLLEHQSEIPKEWKSYYISFTSTVWQDPDGIRRVPYLRWFGGQWFLHFYWLEGGWYSYGRLLCFSK